MSVPHLFSFTPIHFLDITNVGFRLIILRPRKNWDLDADLKSGIMPLIAEQMHQNLEQCSKIIIKNCAQTIEVEFPLVFTPYLLSYIIHVCSFV